MKVSKTKVAKLISKAENRVLLSDIPVAILQIIESATKGGAYISLIINGKNQGQVTKAALIGPAYRCYVKRESNSGERRFSKDEIKEQSIYLDFSA